MMSRRLVMFPFCAPPFTAPSSLSNYSRSPCMSIISITYVMTDKREIWPSPAARQQESEWMEAWAKLSGWSSGDQCSDVYVAQLQLRSRAQNQNSSEIPRVRPSDLALPSVIVFNKIQSNALHIIMCNVCTHLFLIREALVAALIFFQNDKIQHDEKF